MEERSSDIMPLWWETVNWKFAFQVNVVTPSILGFGSLKKMHDGEWSDQRHTVAYMLTSPKHGHWWLHTKTVSQLRSFINLSGNLNWPFGAIFGCVLSLPSITCVTKPSAGMKFMTCICFHRFFTYQLPRGRVCFIFWCAFHQSIRVKHPSYLPHLSWAKHGKNRQVGPFNCVIGHSYYLEELKLKTYGCCCECDLWSLFFYVFVTGV